MLLCSVPPAANSIREQDPEQQSIDGENVVVVPFRDDPCWQCNANRERLLSVWVAILDKIIPDLLIRQRFVGFGQFDKAVVKIVNGFVGTRTNLIRMKL